MTHYENFYKLHHQDRPLVIANAWNVKSAQLIEQSGFAAIATSSGAISNSLGYDDGEKMPFAELLYILKRIKVGTTIPLTVDMERGYTNDLYELADHIHQLISIGVAGINIEDAQGEELFLKKLDVIKDQLNKNKQQLFINARTDGFLQKVESPLETTIKRAALYAEAGADGLFVTGVSDAELITEIAASVSLPLNVVATPRIASFKTLAQCGVRRISMAAFLYRGAYAQLDRLIREVTTGQSLAPLY